MGLTQITTGGVDDNISFDSNTLKLDGTNNRVGIGTASPSELLHVNSGRIKVDTTSGARALTLNAPTNGCYVTFETAGTAFADIGAEKGAIGSGAVDDLVINARQSRKILFRTNSAERLRIDSSGNVGIGTTSPSSRLHLVGTDTAYSGNVAVGPIATLADTAGRTVQIVAPGSVGEGGIGTSTNHDFTLFTSNTEKVRLTQAGNVGIGTTSPAHGPLHVHSSSTTAYFHLTNSTTGSAASDGFSLFSTDNDIVLNQRESANMRFFTANTERMRIDSSGRLLVGTSSTATAGKAQYSLLQVEGNTFSGSNNAILGLARGTAAASISASDSLGVITFTDNAGNEFGEIQCAADATPGASDYPGRITFSTTADGASSPTERMRIDSSGVVKLTQSGNNPRYGSLEASGDAFRLKAFSGNASHNATMQFFTGANSPTERMRLDSSGRLLIGASTATLDQDWANLQLRSTDGAALVLAREDATVTANEDIGSIRFYANDAGSYHECAKISAEADDAFGASSKPSSLRFFTTESGASSPTERIRLDQGGTQHNYRASSGTVIISRTGQSGFSASTFRGYESASSITTGTVSFVVYANGNVQNKNNSYGQISDVKLKENIVDANSQWDDLKAFQIRNWNFKPETGYATHTQIGVVAQEVEAVSPGLVYETPDRDDEGVDLGTVTKGVNYSVLYMKAVKALQEAMDRIETLEAKVAALEAAE